MNKLTRSNKLNYMFAFLSGMAGVIAFIGLIFMIKNEGYSLWNYTAAGLGLLTFSVLARYFYNKTA